MAKRASEMREATPEEMTKAGKHQQALKENFFDAADRICLPAAAFLSRLQNEDSTEMATLYCAPSSNAACMPWSSKRERISIAALRLQLWPSKHKKPLNLPANQQTGVAQTDSQAVNCFR